MSTQTNNSRYSFDTKQSIIELKQRGISSRKIADFLNISKSGVNEAYITYLENKTQSNNGPRVMLFDLETTSAQVFCFGRHKQFINQDAVKTEGGKIICAGYRMLDGETKVLANYDEVKAGEDYSVCKQMWNLFSQVDIVSAHNCKNFDIKMLEARCLANGLPPLPTVKIIDTLEIARAKFRFPSNKLDSLGAYFGVGRKTGHSGISLWVRVQEGDPEALDEMIAYCHQDVELLYDIFMILRNRGVLAGVNFAAYYDDDVTRCKACGSDHLELTGRTVTTGLSSFEEIKCNSCGTLQRTRKNTLSKEKRSKLLA
jgi:DNA polymerase III epsilon subunit-like protein